MNGKIWTEEEDKLLEEVYPNMLTADIMKFFPGRSTISISNHAAKLGVYKSKVFLTGLGKNLWLHGAAHQYKKGQSPANKGIAMSEELRKKVKHTWFQKGQKIYNEKAIGTIVERIDTSGIVYNYVKIANSDWRLLQRETWIEHNGPIPEGHRIHFIDKDTLNCNIENLICISPQDAMNLNRITHLPQELQGIIKLKNKLKNKINTYGTK